ncbi:uncharacterized protein LOC110112144 [Dendrobium catenatum]|uniref:Uncharacterized protein n=1 Tax=Dendrobium catenatum TaxID=906689 RepID=A0A2I0VR72_9ASPA|nr:uncharacterized protein LOC110112144 [Dendrobium catenatum]PKU65912.1 hypothetical protein MA16_Dca008986 [Dendrobium catenatum]
MEKASNIIRSSMHSFFTSYDTFASIATVLILPLSASTLLFSALNPPPSSSIFLQLISFQKPQVLDIFYLKFLHTILPFLLTLPFTLTFLSLAKASIILAARKLNPYNQYSLPISSFLHLYRPLALAQLFNSFLILSTNAIFFLVMFLLFNLVESLGLDSRILIVMISAVGIIFYSMIIANVFVICNLASIVAAMENCRAYEAVIKACLLIRGRTVVALSLAVPTNLAMAAIESVFQVRVMRPYYQNSQFDLSLMCEGLTITYMYSILIVLDIIITCCFYKFCKSELFRSCESLFDYDVELGEAEKAAFLV